SVDRVLARVRERGGDPVRALADVHREALLLIGARDLGGRANLMNVLEELSDLAEASLRVLTARAVEEAAARLGAPPAGAGLLVLGLGKLGGRELGYGSDLDLIAAFEGAGETDRGRSLGELYQKAGQRLQELADATGLYELDHRLRPGGRSAAL